MSLPTTDIDCILQQTAGIEAGVVAGLLRRLEGEYLKTFSAEQIGRHLSALVKLSAANPVAVLLERGADGDVECVVLAFDQPFEFSCITGVMAAMGFTIESSDAFTLPRVKSSGRKERIDRRQIGIRRRDPLVDAVILDFFRGRLVGPERNFSKWAKGFTAAVVEIVGLLNQENEEAVGRAKRLVNERVTRWLKETRAGGAHFAVGPHPNPPPEYQGREIKGFEVRVGQSGNATRMVMRAPDTPAFLYALSAALSLHGLQIERTRARTAEGSAIDEIDVVDSDGKAVAKAQTLQELQRSVLLTMQFAYFLDRAPDPLTALERFEELARQIVAMPRAGEWLELLRNPVVMADLAKLLGASHFLWEDFVKWNADALLPLLERRARGEAVCLPMRSLPRRLEKSLAGAKRFDEQRKRLNEFKDRELFLIDLDHILGEENPDVGFQILSERLVFLAENLVATASRVVYLELVRLYGEPTVNRPPPLPSPGDLRSAVPGAAEKTKRREKSAGFAVFGLGKLGGVALGYASDIELLFLYEADGETRGGRRGTLTNAEFFAILAKETCDYIQAKREGIFEVDLRLRPYGKSGPLACSRNDFARYYGVGGKAHAFERLALVRLRWIAGDSKLGYEIERVRDQILYEDAAVEFAAVWEISAKLREQHSRGGLLNAKHCKGGLADLEQTVLLLQLLHAREAPQLRTPRLHEALDGLRRAGVFSAVEFEQLMGAYQFLRRLINAQRMLRGSAKDLFLPADGSDELEHLARRMGDSSGKAVIKEFRGHTKAVKRFTRKRFGAVLAG